MSSTPCGHDEMIRPEYNHARNEYICKKCKVRMFGNIIVIQARKKAGIIFPSTKIIPSMRQVKEAESHVQMQRESMYLQQRAMAESQRPQEEKKNIVQEVTDFFAPINNQKPMTEEFFSTMYSDTKQKPRPPKPTRSKKKKERREFYEI